MPLLILLMLLLAPLLLPAQDTEPVRTGMEETSDEPERAADAEPLLQELQYRRRHPLPVNTATADQLRALGWLHELQVQSLLDYRQRLGPLLALEELQAVPHWDPATIARLRPYLTVAGGSASAPWHPIRSGEHRVQLLFTRDLELSAGYLRTDGSGYAGGPDRLQLRYRFGAPGLRWGLSAEKDAGEPLFRKGTSIDFLSAHLFYEGSGTLRTLALGDFTVNMGQGLVHWQGLAYGSGADLSFLKRQGPLFAPHRSANEALFHRGVGVTLQKGCFELSGFTSWRCLDANMTGTDGLRFGSFQESGYHRTPGERDDRGRLKEWSAGGRLRYRKGRFLAGVHGITYYFSGAMERSKAPYDFFAPQGNEWFNLGVEYAYTFGNVHLFGEGATGRQGGSALIQGLLWSGDASWDLGLLYRRIDPRFASLGSNAFTRHTAATNEEGLYLTVQARPSAKWQWTAWADLYRFPWLQYRVDAPSGGAAWGAAIRYRPARGMEVATRYSYTASPLNKPEGASVNGVALQGRHGARFTATGQPGGGTTLRLEAGAAWAEEATARGCALAVEGEGRPARRWRLTVRGQMFATGGWDGRIYAWEPDVQGGGPAMALYDNGARWLALLRFDAGQGIDLALRWAQTIFPDRPFSGSSLDRVEGSRSSEIRVAASVRL